MTATSINRVSPYGLAGLLSVIVTNSGNVGVSDFTGCNFKAMILGDTTTLPDLWGQVATLDSTSPAYTLAEFQPDGAPGTLRIDVESITIEVSGENASVLIGDLVWENLDPQGSQNPSHILLYIELADVAADTPTYGDTITASGNNLKFRVPFALLDAVFLPDGSTFRPGLPASGAIVSLRTDGC